VTARHDGRLLLPHCNERLLLRLCRVGRRTPSMRRCCLVKTRRPAHVSPTPAALPCNHFSFLTNGRGLRQERESGTPCIFLLTRRVVYLSCAPLQQPALHTRTHTPLIPIPIPYPLFFARSACLSSSAVRKVTAPNPAHVLTTSQMDARNACSSTRSRHECRGCVTASTRTMSTPPPSQ
jgi:hypothetical protein